MNGQLNGQLRVCASHLGEVVGDNLCHEDAVREITRDVSLWARKRYLINPLQRVAWRFSPDGQGMRGQGRWEEGGHGRAMVGWDGSNRTVWDFAFEFVPSWRAHERPKIKADLVDTLQLVLQRGTC